MTMIGIIASVIMLPGEAQLININTIIIQPGSSPACAFCKINLPFFNIWTNNNNFLWLFSCYDIDRQFLKIDAAFEETLSGIRCCYHAWCFSNDLIFYIYRPYYRNLVHLLHLILLFYTVSSQAWPYVRWKCYELKMLEKYGFWLSALYNCNCKG